MIDQVGALRIDEDSPFQFIYNHFVHTLEESDSPIINRCFESFRKEFGDLESETSSELSAERGILMEIDPMPFGFLD